MFYTRCLLISNNFAGLAALVEVCALLSAVLGRFSRHCGERTGTSGDSAYDNKSGNQLTG